MNAPISPSLLSAEHAARARLAGWRAELSLEFARRGERTVLARQRHDGPLRVQKPLYPEDPALCHVLMLHPPAGLAGGDSLSVTARVGEGAQLLLSTPGAGKWYRSAGQPAPLAQRIEVEAGACCEWLPQENILYDGALARLDSEIRLQGDAVFIGAEMLCLGRTGAGERFANGELRLLTRLFRDDRLLWLERGRLGGGDPLLDSPAGLAGQPVSLTLIASAPADKLDDALYAACREAAAAAPEDSGEGAVTRLPGVLLARWRGPSCEAGRRWLLRQWAVLRPALCGRPACIPRIWHT